MFGVYRTVLALFVVMQHLGGVPIIGQYAVQGFFVLSGYLMTYVMHNSYGYSARGRLSFTMNRFLRLYPSYWATVILTLIVITLVGSSTAATFHPSIRFPDNPQSWLSNLTMLYPNIWPNTVTPRLSPATWALTLELIFYGVICIGASANYRLTLAWAALGLAYHVVITVLGFGTGLRYFAIPSASLPFALGGLMYFFRQRIDWSDRLSQLDGNVAGAVVCAAPFALAIIAMRMEAVGAIRISTLCYYANMVAAVGSVALLQALTGSRKIDSAIGDLSYHIYILHWIIGMVVFSQMFDAPSADKYTGMIGIPVTVTLLICVAISVFYTETIDKPIERLRRQIKARSPSQLAMS